MSPARSIFCIEVLVLQDLLLHFTWFLNHNIGTLILNDCKFVCLYVHMYILQEQLSQNNRVEEVKHNRGGEESDSSCLRKELEASREQLKRLKSELLRKEYKHDTEMVYSLHHILPHLKVFINPINPLAKQIDSF